MTIDRSFVFAPNMPLWLAPTAAASSSLWSITSKPVVFGETPSGLKALVPAAGEANAVQRIGWAPIWGIAFMNRSTRTERTIATTSVISRFIDRSRFLVIPTRRHRGDANTCPSGAG